MKIGYIRLDHGEWTNGSYNSQEVGLARAYEKLGHDITIFYCVYPNDNKVGTTVEISKNIRKCYLSTKSFGHHALIKPKTLDKYELDLLHIQGDNLLKVPEMVRYCKKRKLPCYCYVGRIDSEKTGRIHHFLADIMVQRNISVYKRNKVFTKTPSVKKQLDPSNKRNNIKVASVGLDLSIIPEISDTKDVIRKKLNLSDRKIIITCVCGLRDGKRPYDIFDLAKQLDQSNYIVFIGGWDQATEDAFRLRIKKEKLEDKIRYINQIPNTEIHNYYVASDYVINFNPNEIFGMAILEAMYQKCTVVARRAPGPNYIIQDKISGYLVDTIEEMVEVINTRNYLGDEAKERIIEKFNWLSTAKLILKEMGY